MSPLRKPCPKTATSKADTTATLDAVLDGLTAELVAGNHVALAVFGTVRNPRARRRAGRNPQTGESIDIAASTSAAFKPAAALKRAVAGN